MLVHPHIPIIINGVITMENNTNESMSREELRNQKRNQLNSDQEVTSYDEPKKKKKRKHRRHRKFWLSILAIFVVIIAIFIWIGSRSSLTGSWVEISNANGTTYTSVTDIDDLSTLTIKSGKYTYTANNDSNNATTGTFDDNSSDGQAVFDSDTTNYTLTADNDQVTFTASGSSINGLGSSTVTFVRVNSSEYRQIKAKIKEQNKANTASSSSDTTSESSSTSNKIGNTINSIKDKVTNSSSSDTTSESSSEDSSSASSSSDTDTTVDDNSNTIDNIKNQIQDWINKLGLSS